MSLNRLRYVTKRPWLRSGGYPSTETGTVGPRLITTAEDNAIRRFSHIGFLTNVLQLSYRRDLPAALFKIAKSPRGGSYEGCFDHHDLIRADVVRGGYAANRHAANLYRRDFR